MHSRFCREVPLMNVPGSPYLFYASDDDMSRQSFSGLKGCWVVVDLRVHPPHEGLLLDQKKLLFDIQVKLRMNGIHVFSEEEFSRVTTGNPFLYINAMISKFGPDDRSADIEYVFSIHAALKQSTYLTRNTEIKIVGATTWFANGTGVCHGLLEIGKRIYDLIDEFIRFFPVDQKQSFANRYIIDCGGWKGDSVKELREIFDPGCDICIHTFEAHPRFASFYENIENHMLHSQAVWTREGEIDFYLQEDDPVHNKDELGMGHSLFKEKRNIDSNKMMRVPSIDFSKWILDSFRKDDFIILKMDIEGAEYDVLNKMIQDGSMSYIDALYVEFHHDKYPEIVSKTEYDKICSQIKVPTFEINPY